MEKLKKLPRFNLKVLSREKNQAEIRFHFLTLKQDEKIKIEWLQEIKRLNNEEQHYYIFLLIQQNNFLAHCKLISNNAEIIACKVELFKNPIMYFINQEISAEKERSIAIVSAP